MAFALGLFSAALIANAIRIANAASSSMVINEMLPNPVSDGNGNGKISEMNDEFLELFNIGKAPVDLIWYALKDTPFRSTPGEHS